jgi:hypothetical protein
MAVEMAGMLAKSAGRVSRPVVRWLSTVEGLKAVGIRKCRRK